MRHVIPAIVLAVCLATAGIASARLHQSGTDTTRRQPKDRHWQTSAPQKPGTQLVQVTGCVAAGAQAGSYTLTAKQDPLAGSVSQRMSGTVPSPVYQLIGDAKQLQGLVGHRVQVKGTTDKQPEKTVKNDQAHKTESQPTGTSGPGDTSNKGPKAQVKTETDATVELRTLKVQTVTAVEGGCGK